MFVKKTHISFAVDHFTAYRAQIFPFLDYFVSHQCFYMIDWILLNFHCLFNFFGVSEVVKELLLLELFNFDQISTFDSKQPNLYIERFHEIDDGVEQGFFLIRIFHKIKSLVFFLKRIVFICQDNIHGQKS